jgi:hypothetical protein
MSGGGGGGGSNNTVTQVQQIPEYAQQYSQANNELAQSISSQPYPVYQGPLIQGFSPLQQGGQYQAVQAAGAYQPYLDNASHVTQGALDPSGVNTLSGMSLDTMGRALQTNAATPGMVQSYMSPYVEAALAPSMHDLQLQLGQQQKAIDAQATQAGAFGDARHGVAQSLQNYYGNQAMNELVGTGYDNAYKAALAALQGQQQAGLAAAGQQAGLAGLQGQQQQLQLAGGQQLAGLGGLAQQLGLTGAGAIYTAGEQQQQLGQQELNAAYQQYLNQVNWPLQMLNIRESALSNNPYNIATSVQLPQANTAAQGFGALTGLAGLLGGAASGSRPNVYGGA